MSTALVTGASGFIGPRLVARLQAAGNLVACLVRPTSQTGRLEALGARLAYGDVTDRGSLDAALDGVDVVHHLAGRTHALRYADFLRVNEQGTANLMAAAAARPNPPRVVVVSSLAAVGPSPPGAPHTESVEPRPVSQYGRSKLAGELAARRLAGDVPTTLVRPPVVFGPGDRDGLTLFLAIRRTRLHLVPQMQGLPLSLIHADDLADALARAAECGERLAPVGGDPAQGVYHPADPQASSYAEMGRLAAAALGCRVLVICRRKYPFLIPALVGDLVGRLTGRPTLFGMDKLREASASGWVTSNTKCHEQLGFAPGATLAQRYRETCAWYQAEGWL